MAMTATQIAEEQGLRFDLRKRRAQALTAMVLQIVGDRLCEHGDRNYRRDVTAELIEAFYFAGAELITDIDRQQAGLPLRDELGWTDEELRALEGYRLKKLLEPFAVGLDTIPKD